ncbi:MAG TPA: carbohydrate binding domain-containing protein [Pyrinomonadaceae bacterium]|nr:carbohydrate binding domain-containing protein [Pyrinomonadaceae bacterium]
MRAAARIGFSRLLTRYAVAANSLAAADQAIQLTPDDPDAHRARAAVLNRLHRAAEAEASLETATSLRKDHAVQWLELGTTREELEDDAGADAAGVNEAGALVAYDQAVRCAPYYGQTHWQRGNLLLRLGRYADAFADLRQGAASNRKFLPNLIDLAWSLTKGDVSQTQALVQPANDDDRLEFARFLARKGKGEALVEQVGLLATPLSDQNRQELTRLAFAAGNYEAAYQLSSGSVKTEAIVNGGFEEPLLRSETPFGWRLSSAQATAKLAIDVSEKAEGHKSLQATFEGNWDASATSPISQTIVVQSEGRYRLSFAVKTKDLITGGPPRIVLTDATNNQILAKSDAFPQTTNMWQHMNVEFSVPAKAEAVIVSLTRDNCSSSPCPIFGVLWLDAFALTKL